MLVRTDPTIAFDWGAGASPGPGVPADNFLARWTGFVTPPAGQWQLGAGFDDAVRIWVDEALVMDTWVGAPIGGPFWGSTVVFDGQPHRIRMEFAEISGGAAVSLWARGVGPNASQVARIVPTEWLSTVTETLPAGWSASASLNGETGDYSSVSVTESSVVVTDTTGTAHTYAKKSEGGYAAPEGEYGVLAVDAAGLVTLTEDDGTVYVFTAAGKVSTVTSPVDARTAATPISSYRDGTGQLDRITDPVSARFVQFAYSGQKATDVGLTAADTPDPSDTDATAVACPVSAGYAAPPAGMVCRIVYPGHVPGAPDTTSLVYDASGRLVRIVDPGNEVSDFGYDSEGRLTSVRDPSASDWLTADATRNPSGPVSTQLEYDTTGRITTVTLPAADGTTTTERTARTITYSAMSNPNLPATGANTGRTYVDAAGLTPPTAAPGNGHARTVTFDNAWRQLTDRSATGLVASQVWNAKDLILSSTDPQGRMSTTIYDQNDRVTDTYGPAPASCYGADRHPLVTPPGSCGVVPAHTSTRYDEGLRGLSATYWTNDRLAGPPTTYATGVPGTNGPAGDVNVDWSASTPPPAGITLNQFSARLTGTITFPQAGQYAMVTFADDGVRVWVDDVLVVDSWAPGAERRSADGPVTATTAGQTRRIRIDYYNTASIGSLKLHWITPTGSGVVPGSALSPDYGLVTSTTTDDSAPSTVPDGATAGSARVPAQTTSTEYGTPWLGLPTATVADPGGLGLRTETTYEALGGGYLRRLTKRLPAAVTTGTPASAGGITSTYYGPTQTIASAYPAQAAPCALPGSTNQGGMARSSTSAVPATPVDGVTGTTAVAQTVETVYDHLGRAVGSRRGGETDWTCSTFDARGRTVSVSYPAYGGSPARTVTSDHSVGGDPLTSSVTDPAGTITSVVDLLGRAVKVTDVWGVVTITEYDPIGRAYRSTTTPPGSDPMLMSSTFDPDGNVLTVAKDGAVLTTATYTIGELTSVTYPSGDGSAGNGTAATIGRDLAGALTSLGWTFPDSQDAVTDTVIRSQSGRVINARVTDGALIQSSAYTFDRTGRMVAAAVPRHSLTYDYTLTTGCAGTTGAVAAAGRNGNRMRTTDSLDGAAGTTTTYCYDAADRLLGTTTTNPVTGASPVNGTNLTTGGTAPTLAYDPHGNTTRLANQTLAYDSADRHTGTTVPAAGSTPAINVSYVRDATDRIVSRTETTGSTATTTRYGYTAGGDTADLTLTTSNQLTEQMIGLPGGVTLTDRPASTTTTNTTGPTADVWAYPNIHGDITVTAGPTGTRASTRYAYDPFGQPIDTSTGRIGTTTADQTTPDTTTGNLDNGWLGQHARPYEHGGTIALIEMGARGYSSNLGRFLEVDAVEGGCANSYAYVRGDPVNTNDLTGNITQCQGGLWHEYQGIRINLTISRARGIFEMRIRTPYNARQVVRGVVRGPFGSPPLVRGGISTTSGQNAGIRGGVHNLWAAHGKVTGVRPGAVVTFFAIVVSRWISWGGNVVQNVVTLRYRCRY